MLVFARLFGSGVQQITLHLDVKANCTVGDFKALINKQHPEVKIVRLLFGGGQLNEEGKQLVDYHVQKESTIQVFGKKQAVPAPGADAAAGGAGAAAGGGEADSTSSARVPDAGQDASQYGDVLIVHLIEARNLVAMDKDEGRDTSDPYVIFALGDQTTRSSMIERTLDPRWNETFGFLVGNANMNLSVILMDHDMCSADDPLGGVNIPLSSIKRGEKVEQFFRLTGVPHGEVHLSLQRAAITSAPVHDCVQDLVRHERPWTRQDLENRYLTMDHILGQATFSGDVLDLPSLSLGGIGGDALSERPPLMRHQSAPAPNGQFRRMAADPQHLDEAVAGDATSTKAAAVAQIRRRLSSGRMNLSSERGGEMVTRLLALHNIVHTKDPPSRYLWLTNIACEEYPEGELRAMLDSASEGGLKQLSVVQPRSSATGVTKTAFAVFTSNEAAIKAALSISLTDVRAGFGRHATLLDAEEEDAGLNEREANNQLLLQSSYHAFVRFSGPHPVGGESTRKNLDWKWAWMAVQAGGIVQLFPSLQSGEPAVSLSLEDVIVTTQGPWSLQVMYQTQDEDKRAAYLFRAVDPSEAKTWREVLSAPAAAAAAAADGVPAAVDAADSADDDKDADTLQCSLCNKQCALSTIYRLDGDMELPVADRPVTCAPCLVQQAMKMTKALDCDGIRNRFSVADLHDLLSSSHFNQYLDATLQVLLQSENFIECPQCHVAVEAGGDLDKPSAKRTVSRRLSMAGEKAFLNGQLGLDERPLSASAMEHCLTDRFTCRNCSTVFCRSCGETPYHMGFNCKDYVTWKNADKCRFCHGTVLGNTPDNSEHPWIKKEDEEEEEKEEEIEDGEPIITVGQEYDSTKPETADLGPRWINRRVVDLPNLYASVDVYPTESGPRQVLWSKGQLGLHMDDGYVRFVDTRDKECKAQSSNGNRKGYRLSMGQWSTVSVRVQPEGLCVLTVRSKALRIDRFTRNNSDSSHLNSTPLQPGAKLYTDNDTLLKANVELPFELTGATLIQTRKQQYRSNSTSQYGFRVNCDGHLYVLVPSDEEAPRWLKSGFTLTGAQLEPDWDKANATLQAWKSKAVIPAGCEVHVGGLFGKHDYNYVMAVSPTSEPQEWRESCMNYDVFPNPANHEPILWGARDHPKNNPFKGQMRNLRFSTRCMPKGIEVETPQGRGVAVGGLRKDQTLCIHCPGAEQDYKVMYVDAPGLKDVKPLDSLSEHQNSQQHNHGKLNKNDKGAWIGQGDIQKDFWSISAEVKPDLDTTMCVLSKGHENGGAGFYINVNNGRLKLFNCTTRTWLEGPHVPKNAWSTISAKYTQGQLTLGVKAPRAQIKEVVYTPDRYEYKYQRAIYGSFVKFKVKAKACVHIALSAENRDLPDMYEIALDPYENLQGCVIRRKKQGNDLVSKAQQNLLAENSWKDVWVSWSQGTVRVGCGTKVGSSEVCHFKDPNPLSARYVGVSTGWGHTGSFDFNTDDFIAMDLSSKGSSAYRWLPSPGATDKIWADQGPNIKRLHMPQELLPLGATIIKTSNQDKTRDVEDLYKFRVAGSCRVYLAFVDSPVTKVPEWVEKEFVRTQLAIEHDEDKVKLNIWRRRQLSTANSLVKLHGAAQPKHADSRNYMVLVVPRDEDDDAQGDEGGEAGDKLEMVQLTREFETQIDVNSRPFYLGAQVTSNGSSTNVFYGHIKELSITSGLGLFKELHRDTSVVCCSATDCVSKALDSCPKNLPCGHPCYGCRREGPKCLPCLHADCKAFNPALTKMTQDDQCSICTIDSIAEGPSIQLESCGHIFHKACIDKRLETKWMNKRIDFSFMDCTLCKKQMKHPSLTEQLRPYAQLRKRVEQLALARLEFEGLQKDEALLDPTSRFFEQPGAYAMHRYSFQECHVCKNPYFAGAAACGAADAVNQDWDPADLVCAGCQSGVQDVQSCPKHGTDWLGFKCRFCCTASIWYCFSAVHFCEPCHNNNGELVSSSTGNKKKLHEYTQCPGLREMIDKIMADGRWNADQKEEKIKKLVSDPKRCPLGIRHPPNGVEFGLGCILCQEKEDENEHSDLVLETTKGDCSLLGPYSAAHVGKDSSSVRSWVMSNVPVHALEWVPDQKVAYYEVEVKEQQGAVCVGLAVETHPAGRQAGWEPNSWGWHGDDGCLFHNAPHGLSTLKKFKKGDVVGFGLDFQSSEIFCTLNGELLGPQFKKVEANVSNMLHAIVSFSKKGQVYVNFGQKPFLYKSLSKPSNIRAQTMRTFEFDLLSPGIRTLQSDTVLELRAGPSTWQTANTLRDLKEGTHHFQLSVLASQRADEEVARASSELEIAVGLRASLPKPVDVPEMKSDASASEQEEEKKEDEEDEEDAVPVIVPVAADAAAAVLPPAAAAFVPPSGVQNHMNKSLVAGWKEVLNVPYSENTKMEKVSVPSRDKGWIFVGARKVANKQRAPGNFYIGAFGKLPGALAETKDTKKAVLNNGAYWYNVKGKAFGYADVEDINLASADSKDRSNKKRLSWHQTSSGGWRAGDNTGLNSDKNWRKEVYYWDGVSPLVGGAKGGAQAKLAAGAKAAVAAKASLALTAADVAKRTRSSRRRKAYCQAVHAGRAKELEARPFDGDGADVFKLLKAEYGAGAEQRDVMPQVSAMCTAQGVRFPPKKDLNFTQMFGDPAPGRYKKLTLEYEWRDKKRLYSIDELRGEHVVIGEVTFDHACTDEGRKTGPLRIGDKVALDINLQMRHVEYYHNGWSRGGVVCADLDAEGANMYHLFVGMRSRSGLGSAGAQVKLHRDTAGYGKQDEVRYDLQKRAAATTAVDQQQGEGGGEDNCAEEGGKADATTFLPFAKREKRARVVDGMVANPTWEVTDDRDALSLLSSGQSHTFEDMSKHGLLCRHWGSTTAANAVAMPTDADSNVVVVNEGSVYTHLSVDDAVLEPDSKYSLTVQMGALDGKAESNGPYEIQLTTHSGVVIASVNSQSAGVPSPTSLARLEVELSVDTGLKGMQKFANKPLKVVLGKEDGVKGIGDNAVVYRSVSLKSASTFAVLSGVQYDVPDEFVTGWTSVYDVEYSAATKIPQIDFPSRDQGWIFVAAREGQEGPFYVGAVGQLPGALAETKSTSKAVENNGAYWYNHKDKAFGFAGSEDITLSSADAKDSRDRSRLSWHQTGSGGYRAGDKTGLNGNKGWRKYIFYHPGTNKSHSGSGGAAHAAAGGAASAAPAAPAYKREYVEWSCGACTLINDGAVDKCAVCETARPDSYMTNLRARWEEEEAALKKQAEAQAEAQEEAAGAIEESQLTQVKREPQDQPRDVKMLTAAECDQELREDATLLPPSWFLELENPFAGDKPMNEYTLMMDVKLPRLPTKGQQALLWCGDDDASGGSQAPAQVVVNEAGLIGVNQRFGLQQVKLDAAGRALVCCENGHEMKPKVQNQSWVCDHNNCKKKEGRFRCAEDCNWDYCGACFEEIQKHQQGIADAMNRAVGHRDRKPPGNAAAGGDKEPAVASAVTPSAVSQAVMAAVGMKEKEADLAAAAAAAAVPTPYKPPPGIMNDIDRSFLDKEWTVVYDKPYKDRTKVREMIIPKVPDKEDGYLFVGAVKKNSDKIILGAVGHVKEVLKETQSTKEAHQHNGVFWYNNPKKAFGFADRKDVNLSSADTKDKSSKKRLSWHQTGSGGWRAGSLTNLNSSDEYRKIVFWRPATSKASGAAVAAAQHDTPALTPGCWTRVVVSANLAKNKFTVSINGREALAASSPGKSKDVASNGVLALHKAYRLCFSQKSLQMTTGVLVKRAKLFRHALSADAIAQLGSPVSSGAAWSSHKFITPLHSASLLAATQRDRTYLVGGAGVGSQATRAMVLDYHLDANALPSMPEPLTFPSVMAHHDHVYVIGGMREGPRWGRPHYNEKVFKLDTRALRWTALPDKGPALFPQQCVEVPAVKHGEGSHAGYVLVYGAMDREVWRFWPETGRWEPIETRGKAPPAISDDFGVAIAEHNGTIFFYLGSAEQEGQVWTLKLDETNLPTGEWHLLRADGCPSARQLVGGVKIGNDMIVCGATAGPNLQAPRAFNLEKQEWSELAMSGGRLPYRARFTLGLQENKLLLIGGQNEKNVTMRDIAVVELSKPHRMH